MDEAKLRAQVEALRNLVDRHKNSASTHGKRKLEKAGNKNCKYYIRYGTCRNGTKCPFVHDKSKVSICRNIIDHGSCDTEKCLLSHTIDHDKMPACRMFQQGRCSAQECRFRHVKVNVDAEICRQFVNGNCTNGDSCKYRHQYQKNKVITIEQPKKKLKEEGKKPSEHLPIRPNFLRNLE